MIKGILFDLDGTLIDSMPFWRNIGREFLISQEKEPEDNLNEILKEMSFKESAEYFISKYDIKMTINKINDSINNMIEDSYKHTIQLKPYVKEILKKLKSKNIKMCIVTATYSNLATDVLRQHNILDEFEFVLSSEDLGMGKDNPQIYLKAVERLGVKAKDVLVIEDSLYCIKAANIAGLKTVGIYDDEAKFDQVDIRAISDYYIKSLKEIEVLI